MLYYIQFRTIHFRLECCTRGEEKKKGKGGHLEIQELTTQIYFFFSKPLSSYLSYCTLFSLYMGLISDETGQAIKDSILNRFYY